MFIQGLDILQLNFFGIYEMRSLNKVILQSPSGYCLETEIKIKTENEKQTLDSVGKRSWLSSRLTAFPFYCVIKICYRKKSEDREAKAKKLRLIHSQIHTHAHTYS